MSKFVIECPSCGRYAEARSGLFGTDFFAQKEVKCACGHIINVKAEKLTSRICTHCGNDVIFDRSKGEDAICPVCHEKINTRESMASLVEFSCPSCSCKLSADKSADIYICPLCETKIDIQHQIAKEKVRNQGIASVIKYEGGNDVFVWKHPIEDFNLGSQLIVHESQEALFFKDGKALDLFGPNRHTLTTQNLPILEELYKLPTNSDEVFHSEIYFINKTVQMGIKWGTPDKVTIFEPRTNSPIQLGVSGEMNLQVIDSRKLIVKLVGTMKGIAWDDKDSMAKSLKESFRPMISSAVKTTLPAIIKDKAINIFEIDANFEFIAESLKQKISSGFEEYGLTVPNLYITSVLYPENDKNFEDLKKLYYTELEKKKIEAKKDIAIIEKKSEAELEVAQREVELQRKTTETEVAKIEAEKKVIEAQAEAQAKRMIGMTEAEIMRAKGYNEKDIIQADVQKAYAESIGKMGENMSSGGGNGITGDMMGLGIGLAAASAVIPQVNGMMQGFNSQHTFSTGAPTAEVNVESWNCSCGSMSNTDNFCPKCGANKPLNSDFWNCIACGKNNITTLFCPDCGAKKPEPPATWNCSCGMKNISSNFCPNCGEKKPKSPATWNCSCGAKDITSKFCPECGQPKGE